MIRRPLWPRLWPLRGANRLRPWMARLCLCVRILCACMGIILRRLSWLVVWLSVWMRWVFDEGSCVW